MKKTAALNLRVSPAFHAPDAVNADRMTASELHTKLQRGLEDVKEGRVRDAGQALQALQDAL